MYVVLAWFCDQALPATAMAANRRRFDAAVASLIPADYSRRELGADDWGVTVLQASGNGYRWPVLADDGRISAVSMGLPVGIDAATGPIDLARRLLAGEEVHAAVVPPFGLLALEESRRVAIQQDWLGMCRIFTARSGGVTAFCTRPSLLPAFLGEPVLRDPDGWASYTVSGHFGGELSPIRGVKLLGPGARVTGQRRDGGGWDLTFDTRYDVDDVVVAGVDVRHRGGGEALDLAAEGLTTTAASIYDMCTEEITLGLSGGKDSRLIAASFIAAGRLPRLATNEDTAAEGQTARRLVEILRERRGLHPEHQLVRSGAAAAVLNLGLRERIVRLQRRYDYQYSSAYIVRPPGPERLPAAARPPSLTGAGGELATGFWYPDRLDCDHGDRSVWDEAARSHLMSATPRAAVAAEPVARERDRVGRILDHAAGLGLRGPELADYLYLVERMRRWATSAYFVGMVTPFLAPSVVSATFALTPEQKRDRLLHRTLLEQLLPEWAPVPYVSSSTGPSRATRVWDGDGLAVIGDLLDTVHGELTGYVHRDVVAATAARCAGGRGDGRAQKILQQFAWLAVASHDLEPDGVRPASSRNTRKITRPPIPAPRSPVPSTLSTIARPLRFLKRTRLGSWAWSALRARLIRRATQKRSSLRTGPPS